MGKTKQQRTLTEKQEAFVKNIAAGMGPSGAAHAAGFKAPSQTAAAMLRKGYIYEAIKKERQLAERASLMTKKKVMDGYLAAIEQAKMLADPTAQIQGWNSIAKMCGYFEPTRHKIEVDVKGKVIVERLQQLSDADLLRLADGATDVIEAEVISSEETPLLTGPEADVTRDD